MKYFNNPKTLEELRKQYKQLAKQFHPDLGGSTADMQGINNEYDNLFQLLKNASNKAEQASTSTERDTQYNEAFKDIIFKIIHFTDVEIEIIGSWVWVSGNTYEYKTQLKGLNFKWCKNKTAWAWHTDDYRKRSKQQYSLDDLRNMFGNEKVVAGRQRLVLAQ